VNLDVAQVAAGEWASRFNIEGLFSDEPFIGEKTVWETVDPSIGKPSPPQWLDLTRLFA
jgi:hypothetical protein